MKLLVGDAPFVEKLPKQVETLKDILKLIWKGSHTLATSVEKLAGPVMHLTPISVTSTETNQTLFAGHRMVSISIFQNITSNKEIISGHQWPFGITFQGTTSYSFA